MTWPGRGKVNQGFGQLYNPRLVARLVIVDHSNDTVTLEQKVARVIVTVDYQMGELSMLGEKSR